MQYLEGRKYVVQGIFLLVALIFLTGCFSCRCWTDLQAGRRQKHPAAPGADSVPGADLRPQKPAAGAKYARVRPDGGAPRRVPREVKQLDSLRFCELLQIPLEDLRASLLAAKKYSRIKPSPRGAEPDHARPGRYSGQAERLSGLPHSGPHGAGLPHAQPGPRPGLRGGHHAGVSRKAQVRQVPARRKHGHFGPGVLLRANPDGPARRAVQDGERARHRERQVPGRRV